jgi:Mg2+/citrate symporter
MSVRRADVDQLFLPVVPAMGAGIIWVFLVAWRLGFAERRRLAQIQPPVDVPAHASAAKDAGVTGFPLSPLTASTFILLGLSGVSLRDHQRFVSSGPSARRSS